MSGSCFLFIADVAIGKYYTPKSSGERLPKNGFDSTWAKAGYSGVANDEVIVYTTDQCNLKYLVEFK
jgi:poly [ADP-ribose] polymerase